MNLKQLSRVIKVYTKQIEDLQFEKANLLKELNAFQIAIKSIEAERNNELEFISQNPGTILKYQSFFNSLKIRIQKINESISLVQEKISVVDNKIVELYKEQRKYELLIEKLKLKALEEEKRQELKLFDEISNLKRPDEEPVS